MRLPRARYAVIRIALMSSAGCVTTNGTAHDEDLLRAATAHYAAVLRAGPADSVAAAYTTDGELVLPDMTRVSGRIAIGYFLTPLFAATRVDSAEMHADSIAVTGRDATSNGWYRQVAGPRDGAARVYRGRYKARWRRDADGQWRLTLLEMGRTPE